MSALGRGGDANYLDSGFSWFSLMCSSELSGSVLNLATTTSIYILYIQYGTILLSNHSTLRVLELLVASLNKLQINK
jgi:hypothetical protein